MTGAGADSGAVGVLVVEDDALVRMVVVDALVDEGYRVLEARDAEEALIILGARADVRLVLTDCDMPGAIDGIALARLVHRRWPEIRLLVMSGKIRPDTCTLPTGARFLPKPYPFAMLVRTVTDLLPRSEVSEVTMQSAPVVPGSIGVPPFATEAVFGAAPLPEADKS